MTEDNKDKVRIAVNSQYEDNTRRLGLGLKNLDFDVADVMVLNENRPFSCYLCNSHFNSIWGEKLEPGIRNGGEGQGIRLKLYGQRRNPNYLSGEKAPKFFFDSTVQRYDLCEDCLFGNVTHDLIGASVDEIAESFRDIATQLPRRLD
jgi:hypothetical protein